MSRLHDAARTEARTIGVSVILSAGLRRLRPKSPDGPQRYTLAAGATLGDLLDAIGIDAATDLTAAVDGELAERDTPLRDGAEVMLLVAMEGGSGGGSRSRRRGDHKKGSERRKAVKGYCSKP